MTNFVDVVLDCHQFSDTSRENRIVFSLGMLLLMMKILWKQESKKVHVTARHIDKCDIVLTIHDWIFLTYLENWNRDFVSYLHVYWEEMKKPADLAPRRTKAEHGTWKRIYASENKDRGRNLEAVLPEHVQERRKRAGFPLNCKRSFTTQLDPICNFLPNNES